MMFIQRTK